MTITALPTPPNRTRPATFSSETDAFLAALPTFVTEANALGVTMDAQVVLAESAAASSTLASDLAIAAAGSEPYSASAFYSFPDTVIGSNGYSYRCLGANVIDDDPVTSITGDWLRLLIPGGEGATVTENVASARGLILYDGDLVILISRSTVGDGGGGSFYWDSSDLSAKVTSDPQSGIYIAPTGDLTGASGALVRMHSGLIDVRWFGAISGVKYATSAIQYAIDAGAALYTRSTIFIPPGVWWVNETIVVDNHHTHIVGGGMNNTFLYRDSDYGHTLLIQGNTSTGADVQYVGIQGFRFQTISAVTAGSHLYLNGVQKADIKDLSFIDGFAGITLASVKAATLSNIYLSFTQLFGQSLSAGRVGLTIKENSIFSSHASCGDLFISNFNIRGTTSATGLQYGVVINSSDGCWFNNGHIGNAAVANILFNHVDNSNLNIVFFDNVMLDEGNSYGVFFDGLNATYTARDIKFNNCELSGGAAALSGIVFDTGTAYANVAFNNTTVRWYTGAGVVVQSGTKNISFNNCNVRGNSHGNSGTSPNYNISAGSSHVSIIGGNAGGPINAGGTIYTSYGILLSATADYIVISGVDLSDNITGGMNATATADNVVAVGCIYNGIISVASAAVLSLPPNASIVVVTGTTTINNISIGPVGRVITLKFDSPLTVSDGVGNLRLAGNFLPASTGDTLTLICDGTNWNEISRSNN